MNQTEFAVSQFENRNGITSWRVAGWLHGVRIRKNFKSKEEAAAEKASLELNALQAASGLRATATSLSNEQIREAEAVFRRLEGRTRSLGFYVDFALTNYRDPVRDVSLADATKEYVALREADFKQGNLSKRQFTSYRCELRALEIWFRRKTVAELTALALTEFFKRGNASKKSYNNRRGLISAFLKHGLLKDWVAENVITKVPYFRGVGHRRGSAPTLNAKQCADVMAWAEDNHGGALVPFIALCLFAGIRPDLYEGEISKLDAKDVRLDTGVILIEPHVSKVRMKRNVTIQPNLAAWFRAYPHKITFGGGTLDPTTSHAEGDLWRGPLCGTSYSFSAPNAPKPPFHKLDEIKIEVNGAPVFLSSQIGTAAYPPTTGPLANFLGALRRILPEGGRFRVNEHGRAFTSDDNRFIGIIPKGHWFRPISPTD